MVRSARKQSFMTGDVVLRPINSQHFLHKHHRSTLKSITVVMGFQLNLKRSADVVSGDAKKQRISIGLNKRPSQAQRKKASALDSFDAGSDDESTTTSIDGFDTTKGGAVSGNISLKKKEEVLVITPKSLNSGIKRNPVYTPNMEQNDEETQAAEIAEKKSKLEYGVTSFKGAPNAPDKTTVAEPQGFQSKDEEIRNSILNGEKLHHKKGLVIPPKQDQNMQSVEDAADFDKVPVEQFGAAMLRGMGWKPKPSASKASEKSVSKSIEHRKKGILLGIGAKAVENDLMEDIHGKKGTKISAPLLRRDRTTGKVQPDDNT